MITIEQVQSINPIDINNLLSELKQIIELQEKKLDYIIKFIKSQNTFDKTKYIKTRIIHINNINYLIDDNNIIYDMGDYIIHGRMISPGEYEWF